MKIHFLLLFFACAAFFACQKNNLNNSDDSLLRPVVEAFLQPGSTPTVYVKKQIAYGSEGETQEGIPDLQIAVEEVETGIQHNLVHTDTSAYEGSGWQPQSGKTYRLKFEYLGETIQAETVIPSKPVSYKSDKSSIKVFDLSTFTPGSGSIPDFPDPIELTWDASSGGYYLVVVNCLEKNPTLIFSDTTRFRPFRSFRSTPAQTNVHQLQWMSFRYVGKHHVILYHLNAEYAALYESYGTNSSNLTTPYSNVSGGLGIFTGVSADTLLVNVTK